MWYVQINPFNYYRYNTKKKLKEPKLVESHLVDELKAVSLSMFRKNFLGIFHGSLSAKIESGSFVINKAESIFDELTNDDFVELYAKKDYRWNCASKDSDIHLNIYKNISAAKYVCYTMPPFITSYTLNNDMIIPKDYFAAQMIGNIEVYDPADFKTWYKRAPKEIKDYFKNNDTNSMVIKGYGVYTYSRDLYSLVKHIAILENCCKLLHYSEENATNNKYKN